MNTDEKKLFNDITEYLIKNGFNPSYYGFTYLRRAIMDRVYGGFDKRKVSGDDGLYSRIAKVYKTEPVVVERNIHYVIAKNSGYTDELKSVIKNNRVKHVLFTVMETFALEYNYNGQELGLLKEADNIRLLVRPGKIKTNCSSNDKDKSIHFSYFFNAASGRTQNKKSKDNANDLYYAMDYDQTSPLFDEKNIFLPNVSDEKSDLKYLTTILTYHNNNDISMEGVIRQIPSQIIEDVKGVELINLGLDEYQTVYNPAAEKEQKFIHTRLYTSPSQEEVC